MHVEHRLDAFGCAKVLGSRPTKSFVAVIAVIAALLLVHWQTSNSMVAIWLRSDTFRHGFLVVPAVVWMVWTLRCRLATTASAASWIGVFALAAAGFLWLASELAGALAGAQVALIAMIAILVWALFGVGWLRVLAFPLTFLFFAVPFGDVLVPTLIDWTADFTVTALRATGIPVFREGPYFVIPTGRWAVVEACSGIRYLIASLVVGALYAWTMYRSLRRRAAFVAASVLVPVAANWLRAYLIVMTGHLTDNRIAAGADHLIYGWVFFGIIIGLLFWLGTRWREDDSEYEVKKLRDEPPPASGAWLPSVPVIVVSALLIGVWPLVRDGLLAAGDKREVRAAAIAGASGWHTESEPEVNWRPEPEGAAKTHFQTFVRDGTKVSVYIAYYRDQRHRRELVNSMNRLPSGPEGNWKEVDRGRVHASFGSESAAVRAATLRGTDQMLRVLHWYWVDGQVETSDLRAKVSLALDRLRGTSDTSAWVVAFASAETDAAADSALRSFVREVGPNVHEAVAATAAR